MITRKTEARWRQLTRDLAPNEIAISTDSLIPNDYKVGPGPWEHLPYVLQPGIESYIKTLPGFGTTWAVAGLPYTLPFNLQ